ncbi:hypothetical protein QZH41_013433, partial [Actinostola sp. cb2023]
SEDVTKTFDPQTEADRVAQKCIIGSLLQQYPGLKIVGEEEGLDINDLSEDLLVSSQDSGVLQETCPDKMKDIKPTDVVIWVDPLDGTREFTEGLYGHSTVLIGVSYEGRPVAGIIHQPFHGHIQGTKLSDSETLGRTIWGIPGLGAFGFQRKIVPEGRRIITTTRSHSNKSVVEAIEAMKPDGVLRVGGAGHKVVLVLEGDADGYIFASPGCKRWDTCATEAVLEALGGKLTDVFGSQVTYDFEADNYVNKSGVVASLKDHDLYIAMIPDSVKEGLKVCHSKV